CCVSAPIASPPPLVAGAMASAALVSSAMVEFPTLAASAGAGPDMLAYLEARSLNRTATLALVADTWESVDTKVFRPFRDGIVAGTMHKVDDEEAPVAQMHWEHTRDKLYTPVAVGERSAGSAPHQLKLVDGALAVEEDRPMVPKGIWSVVAIVAYVDWWVGKARLRSHQLDAVVDYWDAASHRLASEMRLGRTFDEVSRDITGDNLAFSEAMLASRQPAKKNHTTQATEDNTGEPDDQPKGKAKGKGTRWRPGKRQRTTTGRDGRDQDWEADWPTRRWTRDDRDDDNRRGGRYQQTGRNDEDRRGQRQWRGQQQWRGQGNDRGEDSRRATLAVRPALRRRRRRIDYIVLSLFDGIGAAPAILEDLYGEPVAAFSWEVDRLCVKLASARLPWMTHRGDFTADSAQAVAAAIEKADPRARAIVIVAAAPPCQDFSRIGSAAGHTGDKGSLFLKSVDFVHDLAGLIGDRRLGFLFENVVMEPKDAAVVSEALGVEPFVACVGLRLDIAPETVVDVAGGDDHVDRPGRGAAAPVEQAGVVPATSVGVTTGTGRGDGSRWPVLPRGGDVRPATVAAPPRRLRMTRDDRRPNGSGRSCPNRPRRDGRQAVPPAAKEKLHMLPPPYTAASFLDDRARHKMLANGWRWGVAVHDAVDGRTVRRRPGTHGTTAAPATDLELPDDDPDMHWHLAGQLVHCTVARRPSLEPALERVLELWTHWRPGCATGGAVRTQLVQDMQETTDEWLAARSAPIRSTYTVPGKTRHTQIPVVLHLLQMVGYPDVAGMTADLTDGFDMLGELRRGPGWKPRTDGRYSNP
ncbi:unnamed protein product, partial [Symbiodinium necroappetens]